MFSRPRPTSAHTANAAQARTLVWSDPPLMSARTALGWQPGGPGRPTNHQKRYQIPRRRPRQVHSCHIRHCSKMHSSAQQPNKHIIALSRRPPAVKTRLPYKREHVFQAAPNISTHRQRRPSTYPRVVGSGLGRPSDGSRDGPAGPHSIHKSPKKVPDSTTQATVSANLPHAALR